LIHLAFVVTSRLPRAKMDDINVEGSRNVFRAAAKEGVHNILYASSVAAYGVFSDHPVPIVENTPRRFQPDFPYAANKYQVEEFLDQFEIEHPQTRVVRIRPTILVGARPQNPLAKLLGRALRRGVMPDTSGDTPMPVVWDEDVADAFMLALKKDVRGAFIVSADEPRSFADLGREAGLRVVRLPRSALFALSAASPALEKMGMGGAIDPAWQDHANARMEVSARRAKEDLGWSPRCPHSVDVMKRVVEIVPGETDRRIATLFRLANLVASREYDELQTRGIRANVHLQLTGHGGGDFTMIADDGRMRVKTGIPRPPTSIATLTAALFLDLLAGRASFATAQFTGQVRIEGDPVAAFMLGGLIARYKQLQDVTGVRGIATRAFSRWINQGGAT
jgi:nucleoside-diphosphate-sugar epimerase